MSRMVIDNKMWSRLEKLLPKPKGRHGEDDRLFMEAIGWMLRTGAAWRDLPPDYGNWKSVLDGLLQGMIKQPGCTSLA
ncbi:transposase [Legionella erythra]|uniref:ISSod6 transposase n=1 Tax=Legionella erythra TaxID=448 RepID=A0A0W0TRM2_LEGER|nr:ISSod6 transposase [Legionella erythra]